ncbi:helix-turn-helix domain-containing protein [Enterococcus ureasiticus]|uniref:Mga helix-turn-helix domain-containing protein n=1 Tax=Enterococcus ureasiticus TaxID=903984 RepID=A0A1E5GA12_9ENTE|nr:helix-turn-helix domain-containing protein [Enterococcus ureasiticus]OEG09529.1 hypothetical protein BCR21_14350 [Enterococcus ureasiticus]
MINILDKMSSRKIELVKILSSETRYFSVKELSEQLNISNKTLVRTVELLKEDMQSWTSNVEILDKNILGYCLCQLDGFSIKEIEVYYYKDSIIYQVIDELFHNKFVDIKTFANERYLSYTVVYTNIVEIRELISDFSLELELNKKIHIKGTEMQIRYFYFSFYWNILGGVEWPFRFYDKQNAFEYIEIIETFYSRELSVSETEFFLYWIGTIFNRVHLMKKSVDCSQFHLYKGAYNELEKMLRPKLLSKNFAADSVDEEVLFIYLILFGFQPRRTYGEQDQTQIRTELNKNIESIVASYWMREFYGNFSVNLTISEQITLYTNLVIQHFRLMVFRGGGDFFENQNLFIPECDPSMELLLKNAVKTIASELFQIDQIKNLNLDRKLIESYYKQELYDLLTSDYRMGSIKVAIISQFGEKINQHLKNIVISKTNVKIEFCSFTDADVDLIISNRSYSEIIQKKNSQAELIIWNDTPTELDKKKVTEVLKKISNQRQYSVFLEALNTTVEEAIN